MNGTPSIFNEKQLNCVILGGRHPDQEPLLKVCAILLNSGNAHMRAQNLQSLTACGFEKIISIENDSKNYNIEDLSQRFPHVKFIICLDKANDGDLVNLAVSEVDSSHFLVLRDTLNITPSLLTSSLSEKLSGLGVFCVVPRVFSRAGQAIPVVFSPSAKKAVLKIDSSAQAMDGRATLYPFNLLGLYDTKKFKELGGFDGQINNPYWQNLDLSFRAWLWGERIQLSTALTMTFSDEIVALDSTPDLSQLRFFLKNMAPLYKNERAEIPFSKFWGYNWRSSCVLCESFRQFAAARAWVRKNRCRYKMDAFKLISEWGTE
ncbi:MAG: hypothetical protein IK094_01410 [Treponema sp.]|nr:hypothetical protein [Treponema sp.]